MRSSTILFFLSLALCSRSYAENTQTNQVGISATNQVDVGVVITSVQAGRPIVVGLERKKYPEPPYDSTNDTSYFFSSPGWGTSLILGKSIVRQWQTNYFLFSQALVSAAEKAGLESASLAKMLEIHQPPAGSQKGRSLPVAAHSTVRNGEAVWVVAFRWETEGIAAREGSMDHIMHLTYTQKTLKLVDSHSCE